jgi:hypothetical protein
MDTIWIVVIAVVVLIILGFIFKTLFKLFIRLIPIALIGLLIYWLLTHFNVC